MTGSAKGFHMLPQSLEDHFPLTSEAPAIDVQTARYIGEMAAELAVLAGRAEMPMLANILHLARLEALDHLNGRDDG